MTRRGSPVFSGPSPSLLNLQAPSTYLQSTILHQCNNLFFAIMKTKKVLFLDDLKKCEQIAKNQNLSMNILGALVLQRWEILYIKVETVVGSCPGCVE